MAEHKTDRLEFISPGMSLFIPLVIGTAVVAVALFGSYRLVERQQIQETKKCLDNARELLSVCLAHIKAGEYEEAESSADRAVTLVPDLAAAYIFRAEARTAMENYPAAIADYTKGLEFDTDPMDRYLAFRGRGKVFYSLGRYQEAEEDFTKALRAQEHRVEAYIRRALTRKKLGDMDGYAADITRAKELGASPDDLKE